MGLLGNLFKRKRGGTIAGRIIRRGISRATMGISDELGVTNTGDNINNHLPPMDM